MVARPVAAGLLGGLALTLAACNVSFNGRDSGNSSGSGASGGPASASAGPVGSGPTGAQVKAAIDAATSVHVSGQVTLRGNDSKLNVGLLRAGDESGTVTVGTVPPVNVIVAQGKFYLLVTQQLLTWAQPALASLGLKSVSCSAGVCGKYLRVSIPQGQKLTSQLGMTQLTASVGREAASAQRAGTATVSGQQAVVLRAADGTVLDVAAHGKPYVLQVSRGAGSSAATLTFTQWDSVAAPAAPPASDLVSLSQL